MPDLRLLFFGTPEFAVPALQGLSATRHPVVGVVSQPDRPRGRGRKLAPTPVRAAAETLGLEVLQPEKVGDADARAWMSVRAPDLGVVVAFGQFIPKSVRELPPHGLVNAHASLLPRWRGAAPIEWALATGDERTGISVMRLVKEMDAGDVCLRRTLEIGAHETAGELSARLAQLAGEVLAEAVDQIAAGRARFEPQPEQGVMLAPKIDRSFAELDWRQPRAEVYARIRAATPRPGADIVLKRSGRSLRIVACRPWEGDAAPQPGAVVAASGSLRVSAADGWIELLSVQAQGRKPLDAGEYLRGASIVPGEEVEA
jgi:methionyl-tRNA formyltransferase